VVCYNAENRHERTETERFKAFTYDELVARDKASLDIFWLRDESLEDTGNAAAAGLAGTAPGQPARPVATGRHLRPAPELRGNGPVQAQQRADPAAVRGAGPGPGELNLFGQRLPTILQFAGPVRPSLTPDPVPVSPESSSMEDANRSG